MSIELLSLLFLLFFFTLSCSKVQLGWERGRCPGGGGRRERGARGLRVVEESQAPRAVLVFTLWVGALKRTFLRLI